jgi:hypothetical protein
MSARYSNFKKLVADTLAWIKEQEESMLVSSESYAFFYAKNTSKIEASLPTLATTSPPVDDIKALIAKAAPHIKLKEKQAVVALVFFNNEEQLFYDKLAKAIEQHLFPAQVIDATQWESEKQTCIPKWILATQDLKNESPIPMIRLSSPEFYQNNLDAKKNLWNTLCKTLALPLSS